MNNLMISLENVTWVREKKTILQQINWNVQKTEHWAILGANGSGKTSLLKLITGYEWATQGSVCVLSERFGQTAIHELRKRIGWLSASLDERYRHYESQTCVEVIVSGASATIGLHEVATNSAIEKAERFAIEAGLSEVMTSPLRTLSQGERKKTFYARARMANPEMIILDEPTSGLDLLAREQFLHHVNASHQQSVSPTLLYVTHYPEEIVPAITHVMVMKKGEILAAGPKKEILTNEILSDAFNVPIHVAWRDERPWIQVAAFN